MLLTSALAVDPPPPIPATSVRSAEASDARTIAEIHRASWRHTYFGMMSRKALAQAIGRRNPRWWKAEIKRHRNILVSESGGSPVGYVTMGRNRISQLPQQGEIYELYLRPEWKRMGLGRELFCAAREKLTRQGYNGLVLWALAENADARAFYERIGGQAIAEGNRRYGDKRMLLIAYAWT